MADFLMDKYCITGTYQKVCRPCLAQITALKIKERRAYTLRSCFLKKSVFYKIEQILYP